MAVRGTTQGLALTPARWATWVAQRHEWNGYLWIRWSDAEAVLLFVSGRPRIHLWDGAGWVEGEHALTTVVRRLERLPPPRWGQVAIPARWAAGLRDLSLVQPALPAEILSPEAWVAWAQRQGFTGVALSPPLEPPPLREFTPPPVTKPFEPPPAVEVPPEVPPEEVSSPAVV